MAVQHNTGTGRRKSAVARVFLKAGKGNIVVNGKPVDEFFSRETGRMIVRQPLKLTENLERFDIRVNVVGVVFDQRARNTVAYRAGLTGFPAANHIHPNVKTF